jgi:hypothetical protein
LVVIAANGLAQSAVIVCEGGRPSTLRALDSIAGSGDYWMPLELSSGGH